MLASLSRFFGSSVSGVYFTLVGSAVVVPAGLLAITPVCAQTATWTGTQSTDWSTARNWSTNSVPVAGTVTINNPTANPVLGSEVIFSGTTLNIGSSRDGTGSLELTNSAFQLNTVNIGTGSGALGSLSLFNSTLNATGNIAVGSAGVGTLILSGPETALSHPSNRHLNIGNSANGYGDLQILDGAKTTVGNVALGNLRGSGSLTVDGAGSLLTITGRDLSAAGRTGDASVTVSNGGQIDIRGSSGWLQLGSNGESVTNLLLTGEGSQISSTGLGVIAEFGTVRARVEDQADLQVGRSLFLGATQNADGQLVVDSEARVVVAEDTVIGLDGGHGTLTLRDGGTLSAAGDVYLSNANASSGTLNIGAAAGEAAAAAGILDAPAIEFSLGSAALVFNHTDTDYVFSAGLESVDGGTHVIDHVSGTTILTGDGTGFAGTTNISGGTLLIGNETGGTLGGTIGIQSGGALGGSGTVGTTTVGEGGRIMPGNSIGALTIDGDITFEEGSLFEAEINPVLQSDLISVTGTALINGGTVHAIKAGGVYTPGSRWTIITADDVTGTFDDLTQNMPFVDLALAYDDSNVYIESLRNEVAFCDVAETDNQCATGLGIESIGADSLLYGAFAALPDEASARSALDVLSGEIHASAQTALIEDSRFIRDAVSDRMRSALGGRITSTLPVLSYGGGGFPPTSPDSEGPVAWGHAFGSWGQIDGTGNAGQLDHSVGGVLTGIDGAITPNIRLGLLAGFSHSTFDVDDRASSGSSDNFHLGLYGGGQWDAFRLSAGLAYTWRDIDTERAVAFPGFADRLTANYDAGLFQVFGEAGYRFEAEAASFEPFVALAHVRLRIDGFAETGGAAALIGGDREMDVTFMTLGFHGAADFAIGGMNATALGTLGWRHAFGDTDPFSTHAFAGGDAFTLMGAPIAENTAIIRAGLDFEIAENTKLGVSYNGQIASDAQEHGFNAKLNVRF